MTTQRAAGTKTIKSKIRPIKKTSISDDIVEQIMTLISKGDLKAGQRLPSERELCKTFGAGRSSLREALRCLSIVGVLTARVGEGTSVALDGGKFLEKIVEWRLITEKHDIENLIEVRLALEGVSAASAAERGTAANHDLLRGLLEKMKAAVNDEKRFAALDLEFHVNVAKASENQLLFDLISMIRGQLAKVLSKVLLLPQARPLSLKEHVLIVDAILRRDSVAARGAMQTHLEAALTRYRTAIESNPA
ncbi:FadR/GntR family transcriptional regulator [Granulicella arctica]|uniref:FadR/GntR family transcriptional regulator n=1 Tax=Granulicella arctica TaxID=940613 RepID=UPI0021E0EFC0|nr:FadR/GntR family transcriptional regulator [Granulicella arctica]